MRATVLPTDIPRTKRFADKLRRKKRNNPLFLSKFNCQKRKIALPIAPQGVLLGVVYIENGAKTLFTDNANNIRLKIRRLFVAYNTITPNKKENLRNVYRKFSHFVRVQSVSRVL